jgi:hypothetical protein
MHSATRSQGSNSPHHGCLGRPRCQAPTSLPKERGKNLGRSPLSPAMHNAYRPSLGCSQVGEETQVTGNRSGVVVGALSCFLQSYAPGEAQQLFRALIKYSYELCQILSVLRDRSALCPQASLLPPVALGHDGLKITKYNRITSALRSRKKQQSPLEIGGQVERIHDLTYSRSRGLRLPLAKFA